MSTKTKKENKKCGKACTGTCKCSSKKNDKNANNTKNTTFEVNVNDCTDPKEIAKNLRRAAYEFLSGAKKSLEVSGLLFSRYRSAMEAVSVLVGNVDMKETNSIAEEFSKLIPNTGKEKEDITDTDLVKLLFKASKYDIRPGSMKAYRARFMEKGEFENSLFVEFEAAVTSKNKYDVSSEGFIIEVSPNMEKAVSRFDKAVESFKFVKFEPKAKKIPVKDEPKQAKPADAKAPVPVEGGNRSPKDILLEESSYDIPKTRFKIQYLKDDKKSRKAIYELRFYKGSYKTAKNRDNYEKGVLRVKLAGDHIKNVVKRFDKVVKELKTVKFGLKK